MSTLQKKDHVTFWQTYAELFCRGITVSEALDKAGEAVAGTDLQAATADINEQIKSGKANTVSTAMADHPDCFPPMVRTMMRCGEAGGVMDVAAARIAEGIERGAFPVEKRKRNPLEEMVMVWDALGIMLSSGTPILHAVELLADEVQLPRLSQGLRAIHRAILDGKTIAHAMREYEDVFAVEVCTAIERGERTGTVDEQCKAIADALGTGDLSGLPLDLPPRENTDARKLVNTLIINAFTGRASDIHLDPIEDGGGRYRLRIDGALSDYTPEVDVPFAEVIDRFKVMAGLNVEERRMPQDGRIMLNVKDRKLDLRVSAVPTVFGERITTRLLDRQTAQVTLEQIFEPEDLPQIERLRDLSHGMVICAGPTGSGKTTLEYAMVTSMDRDKLNVLSVENPVEYVIEGVAQIQVRSGIGLTFARAIRSVLRQDPDVILVGEIRDQETLRLAMEAALTGHLVLTTLHTNDAPSTLTRMLDIGAEPFLVNATVEGVISQRLVRTLCRECRRPAELDPNLLPPEAAAYVKDAADAEFCEPVGCEKCRDLGYRGRSAIHEVLLPDDGFRAAVVAKADTAELREAALAAGMEPMLHNGLRKAAKGLTSVREVLRVLH